MALLDTLKALLGGAWHVNSDAALANLLPAADGTVEANKVVVVDANKKVDTLDHTTIKLGGVAITATAAELNASVAGLLATTAEINRVADVSTRIVSLTTSPVTVSEAVHEGKVIALNLATGVAVTLPAASGTGDRYEFVIGTANSSTNNYTIATAPTTDIFQGSVYAGTDNGSGAGLTWPAASNSNKLTLGGTSHATGGSVGDRIRVTDIAAGVWSVEAMVTQGGTEATPYSHV